MERMRVYITPPDEQGPIDVTPGTHDNLAATLVAFVPIGTHGVRAVVMLAHGTFTMRGLDQIIEAVVYENRTGPVQGWGR